MAAVAREHWDDVWTHKGEREQSWHQDVPTRSLAMILDVAGPDAHVADLGGGASGLAVELVKEGFARPTVVDISAAALEHGRGRAGAHADAIDWVVGDVRDLDLGRTVDVWHDRAVLHFLTDDADRERYVARAREHVPIGGHAIIAAFAPDGPDSCSGLPVRRYDAAELVSLLDGFELSSDASETHETPSGAEQRFTYVTLRRQR